MKQAEILLHIAENTFADGDELIIEWRRRQAVMVEHAKRILEDEVLIEQARALNQQDKERFAQYMPRQDQQQYGQAALGSSLADQRAALAQARGLASMREVARHDGNQRHEQKAQAGNQGSAAHLAVGPGTG